MSDEMEVVGNQLWPKCLPLGAAIQVLKSHTEERDGRQITVIDECKLLGVCVGPSDCRPLDPAIAAQLPPGWHDESRVGFGR